MMLVSDFNFMLEYCQFERKTWYHINGLEGRHKMPGKKKPENLTQLLSRNIPGT